MNEIPLSILKYRVIGASTEDPEHPLFSILSQSPTEGWASVRFSAYPQEILIQFPNPIRLRQLNILLHQHRIPSKIDVFHFFPKCYDDFHKDYNSLTYEKVGYVVPSSNMKSGYRSRELKKIYLNVNCLYLKLVFHKCYINIYNTFNQVGLVSLSCLGFNFTPQNIDILYPSRNHEINFFARNLDTYIPTPVITDVDMDDVCKMKIDELKLKLERANKSENFDNSKAIFNLIKTIKHIAQKIKTLQELKSKAIGINDYDNAKVFKIEIERLRNYVKTIATDEFDNNSVNEYVYDNAMDDGDIKGDVISNNNNNSSDGKGDDNDNGNGDSQSGIDVDNVMTKSQEIRIKQQQKKEMIEENIKQGEDNIQKEKNTDYIVGNVIGKHDIQIVKTDEEGDELQEEMRAMN